MYDNGAVFCTIRWINAYETHAAGIQVASSKILILD